MGPNSSMVVHVDHLGHFAFYEECIEEVGGSNPVPRRSEMAQGSGFKHLQLLLRVRV